MPTAARSPLASVILALLLLLSCAGPANHGLPGTAGQYEVQSHSVSFDGQQYRFFWRGTDGTLHEARARDVKLVQDQRTFLEIGEGGPVLHLAPEEPVAVQHRSGGYSSAWFPFIVPIPVGGPVASGPAPTTPSYRYPPTDQFGRGDTLYGSEVSSRPAPPDYTKVKPAPHAVSGQNGGTGDGTAATNRGTGGALSGQSGGTGSGSAVTDRTRGAVSGQAGGAGSGSAVTDRQRPVGGSGGTVSSRDAPSAGRSSAARPSAPLGGRGRR